MISPKGWTHIVLEFSLTDWGWYWPIRDSAIDGRVTEWDGVTISFTNEGAD